MSENLGKRPPNCKVRSSSESEANAIDLELGNLIRRADLQVDAHKRFPEKRRHWLNVQARLQGARSPARLLMHPEDREATP